MAAQTPRTPNASDSGSDPEPAVTLPQSRINAHREILLILLHLHLQQIASSIDSLSSEIKRRVLGDNPAAVETAVAIALSIMRDRARSRPVDRWRAATGIIRHLEKNVLKSQAAIHTSTAVRDINRALTRSQRLLALDSDEDFLREGLATETFKNFAATTDPSFILDAAALVSAEIIEALSATGLVDHDQIDLWVKKLATANNGGVRNGLEDVSQVVDALVRDFEHLGRHAARMKSSLAVMQHG